MPNVDTYLLVAEYIALGMTAIWLVVAPIKGGGRYWLKPVSFLFLALTIHLFRIEANIWLMFAAFAALVICLILEAGSKKAETNQ